MNFSTWILLIVSIMLVLMIIFSMLISKFIKKNTTTPFECGFNPLSSPRLPFSLHFFLIVILFLIFDIEIILILPFPLMKSKSIMISMSFIISIFILMAGLLFEWVTKFLQW